MEQSDEQVLLSLTNSELRTLLALRQLSDVNRYVYAMQQDVGKLTGLTRESIRIALRGLEERGLVETNRTKRNLGKYSTNQYFLPCQPGSAWQPSPCQADLASTGDSNTISNTDTHTSMYNYIDSHMRKPKFKEVKLVNKWTDDDDIAGVGLFEGEKPAAIKHRLSVDKRDPKTRGRRPQEEWTAADVSVEFSFLLSRKYPYMPGNFQTSPLRGALAKNRKEYGITPLIELEILRMFMGDERNHKDAETKPDMMYRRYLKMFQTHMGEALKNLGMPSTKELADADVVRDKVEEVVYASDGRAFDNSIPGRKSLQKYEEKLRVNNEL